jgi:hypothetical protein
VSHVTLRVTLSPIAVTLSSGNVTLGVTPRR